MKWSSIANAQQWMPTCIAMKLIVCFLCLYQSLGYKKYATSIHFPCPAVLPGISLHFKIRFKRGTEGPQKVFFEDSGLGHDSGFKAKWGWGFGIESLDNMWDVANNNYREYGFEQNFGQDNRME